MDSVSPLLVSRLETRRAFDEAIRAFELDHGRLPGIRDDARRLAFVEQLIDSERRNAYFAVLRSRDIAPRRTDPTSRAFDPLRAAIRYYRLVDLDEAFWMVFLFVHFGRNKRSGWRLAADIYGRLNAGCRWTWDSVSADVVAFRSWLAEYVRYINNQQPRPGFGNHRKYESLDAWSDKGTGAAVASYVDWVGTRGHEARIAEVIGDSTGSPADGFDALYRSLRSVRRFGRTGAFDFCSTVAKLGFLQIEPGMAYLRGSTGPMQGARLLICESGQRLGATALEGVLGPFQAELDVSFDIIEDALCNWQKSPDEFRPFRG